MKKIYITEELIGLLPNIKLPKFLLKGIKHNCFLGDSDAIPDDEENTFIYDLINDRYREVTEKLSEIEELNSSDIQEVSNLLSKIFKECKDIEKDIKPQLEKLCIQVVSDLFNIPENTISLNCTLVEKIEPKHPIRIKPESNKKIKFKFNNTSDVKRLSKEVVKRRMINSLIQGASYNLSQKYNDYITELYKLNKKLPILYDKINILNNYILFNKEDEINDEQHQQGAYVEVEIGTNTTTTNINVQGLLFPFLLTETIRGFMELFASHGLPQDNNEAMFVIKQADFLIAEPWDLRTGTSLWNLLNLNEIDTKLIPYIFTYLCELDEDSFNDALKNVFADTTKGNKIMNMIISNSEKELKLNDLNNFIDIKNNDFALINDGYFNSDEFDSFILDELKDF